MSTPDTRFLLLGFPRSGTTLLSRLLDANPLVSSPPETMMFTCAGRFLADQTAVEGPPLGVMTGLGFLGIPAEDVMAPLRNMLFGFHDQVAGDATHWVEKTATDVFHLETLEPFLQGHARYIALTRNPLDVIASNIDLANVLGAQLPDLYELTRGVNGPHEGLAQAWLDRQNALDNFVARQGDQVFSLRYEDLLEQPEESLDQIFEFMGVDSDPSSVIASAFQNSGRIGLGDFKVHETGGIRPPVKNGWRKRIPPSTLRRIVPRLSDIMERHGYDVPKIPRSLDRETHIRQFQMAMQMKQRMVQDTKG